MININDTYRARDALFSIPADLPRDEWVRVLMGAQAAGISMQDAQEWSATAHNYKTAEFLATWRSIKSGKGIGAGTLFAIAREHGYSDSMRPQTRRKPIARSIEAPSKSHPGMSAAEVWERCEPANFAHPYIIEKQATGVPLDGLRVLPAGDALRIAGESMAGALVVPVCRTDGTISSLQMIVLPAVAQRLKERGKPSKLNLPGGKMEGFHIVGELVQGGVVYICEGIGTAWACWLATGAAAVVCFGWGRVGSVAADIRETDQTARIVLVPDAGKEREASSIAADISGLIAAMPEGWETNSDVHDLAKRDGLDVLEALLLNAIEPPKPQPRYKLINADGLRNLPTLVWRIRGVLPTEGLAALYGPSGSGKSFLAFDMAAAIAAGQEWFGYRVESAPVVYAALEGEAGFKHRAQAWETNQGKALPDNLKMVLQPFHLTNASDVHELAAVVPSGAVIFIDTLNRAAPTADENSSKDMGEILEAAKRLQRLTRGLVVLIHHTGKDTSKGLRGHSSLLAALDAGIEVIRIGDRRNWKVAKSKDGSDGNAHPFRLEIETLGADAYGDLISSCTVRIDVSAETVKQVKVPQGSNQKLVYEGIRRLFKHGCTGKPGAPPLRPCIELEAAVSAGAACLACETHRRTTSARAAITGLVSRGVLGLHGGWLWTAN